MDVYTCRERGKCNPLQSTFRNTEIVHLIISGIVELSVYSQQQGYYIISPCKIVSLRGSVIYLTCPFNQKRFIAQIQ